VKFRVERRIVDQVTDELRVQSTEMKRTKRNKLINGNGEPSTHGCACHVREDVARRRHTILTKKLIDLNGK